jgi:hypothetical protein
LDIFNQYYPFVARQLHTTSREKGVFRPSIDLAIFVLLKETYMDAHILQSIQSLMMSWFRLQPYIRIIFGE